ncbi:MULTISPECIES: hypothetical protein [unclassified Streptomyces]|nr:hypothetical protein [Streptomyces sp. NBC_01429]
MPAHQYFERFLVAFARAYGQQAVVGRVLVLGRIMLPAPSRIPVRRAC